MSVLGQQWAVVEIMGHQKIAGRIEEVAILGTTMLRVEVAGSLPFIRYYGGAAIFSITVVTEEVARRVAEQLEQREPAAWRSAPALSAPDEWAPEEHPDDYGDPYEDHDAGDDLASESELDAELGGGGAS